MLSISSKSTYGLQALLTLGENYGEGLLQVREIAAINAIPLQFLVQIFNLLVKAETIRSVRGKNGGYTLARPPSAITVLEIFEILEGGLEFSAKQHGLPGAVDELFGIAEAKLREVFGITLADLLARQQQLNRILTYDI